MDYRQIFIYVLLLPRSLSVKDPRRERMSHNGFSTISSSAAFLFRNLFECCYLRALDGGQKCLEPQEKQHLVGQDREPKL